MNLKIHFSTLLCVLLTLGSAPSQAQIELQLAKFGFQAIKLLINAKTTSNKSKFEKEVTTALTEIRESTARIESLIVEETATIIEKLKIEIHMKTVYDFLDTVRVIDDRFENQCLKYFTGNRTYQSETINNYLNSTIDPNDFKKTLSNIKKYTVPTNYIPTVNDKRTFEILHDYINVLEREHIYCDKGISAHALMFNVFNVALSALIKGYGMIAHAYKYLQLKSDDKNAWKQESLDTLEQYRQTVIEIAEVAQSFAMRESKVIRRCDPTNYIEGENYDVYEFLNTVATANSVVRGNTTALRIVGGKRSEAFCDRSWHECVTREITKVCMAPVGSKRRYTFVTEWGIDRKYYYKGHYQEQCETDPLIEAERMTFITGRPMGMTKCLCDGDYSKKAAYLNTTPVLSYFVSDNRVITGIRLVTKLTITYFELQTGVLVNGSIDESTLRWDDSATKNLENMEANNRLPDWNAGGFRAINYDNYRSWNLDDIYLPVGWAAVGIRFATSNDQHVTFKVAGVKIFDDEGNIVNSQKIEWFEPTSNENRNVITSKDADVPVLGKKINIELSQPGKHYSTLQMTGWTVDASQTMYPAIDMQQVVTNPPAPVNGIGLFYKSQEGYGGFMAPKLLSTDYNIFMSESYLTKTLNI